MRLMRDERGLAGIIIAGIIGIIALFGFSAASAINWHFIVALLALGLVGISLVAAVLRIIDPKMVVYAVIAALGIVFVVEVNLVVLVGAIMVIGAIYYFKILVPKQLLVFTLMVLGGLVVMLFGYKAVLLPLGIIP